MSYLQSIILGAVQGLTEFLPVSSSGHLAIFKQLLIPQQQIPVLFDILLHIATLIAVLLVFHKRILKIIISLGKLIGKKTDDEDRANLRLLITILIATAATVIIALALEKIEGMVENNTKIISLLFIITGIILIVAHFFRADKTYHTLNPLQGIITGIAQGLGIFPGISRSGITISAALACGIKRDKAGEFSFLISIPAIIGALIIKIKDAPQLLEEVALPLVSVGAVTAFIVGFFALLLLLRIIKKGRLYLFSFYLIPLGIISFFLV